MTNIHVALFIEKNLRTNPLDEVTIVEHEYDELLHEYTSPKFPSRGGGCVLYAEGKKLKTILNNKVPVVQMVEQA